MFVDQKQNWMTSFAVENRLQPMLRSFSTTKLVNDEQKLVQTFPNGHLKNLIHIRARKSRPEGRLFNCCVALKRFDQNENLIPTLKLSTRWVELPNRPL